MRESTRITAVLAWLIWWTLGCFLVVISINAEIDYHIAHERPWAYWPTWLLIVGLDLMIGSTFSRHR